MLKNIDVLKYLMSILVVMIHAGYSYEIPFLRVAVPVFFILSSYLFFSRLPEDDGMVREALMKFLKRASMLYLFWFVVLLPTTFIIRDWYQLGVGEIIEKIILGVLIRSTFPASWYISAYIIGIVIACMLRKHDRVLLTIGVITFVICCLTSNYYYLLAYVPYGDVLQKWTDNYEMYNSFPMGLLYIYMGMKLKGWLDSGLGTIIFMLVAGIVLLYMENGLIQYFGFGRADDAYFSLSVLAPAMVMMALKLPSIDIREEFAVNLRKMSTIYYCSHLTLLMALRSVMGGLEKYQYLIIVLIICTIESFLIIKAQKNRVFSWLKYSY